MPKLTATVIVRDPETGAPAALLAGTELPAWAKDLVGDHVIEKPTAKKTTPPKTDDK